MSNAHRRIDNAQDLQTGKEPGNEILEKFKEVMLTEEVFKKLFGEDGAKISIDDSLNISEKNVPVLEIRIIKENFPTQNSYQTGTLEGRLLLPPSFKGGYNSKRRLALMFARFLRSPKYMQIFDLVPGLRALGTNFAADYSILYRVGSISLPAIRMTFNYELDPVEWFRTYPEIDPYESLSGESFDIDSSDFNFLVDDTDEILVTSSIYPEEP